MSSPWTAAAARQSAETVRRAAGSVEPEAAIVLGSGLGGLADEIADAVRIPFRDIPGFPSATVAGHAGALICGTLGGRRVVALAGRFHMYEGHAAALAAFPVRVMHALGARALLVSNAAGGIRDDLSPGDLMLIEDHLNLTFSNPLTGAVEEGDERFPDMSRAYDAEFRTLLNTCAGKLGIPLKAGVYACLAGPSYETPAEIRMLARLGADAVGMSTVPEVIVARALGMRVAGISCITNAAAGVSEEPILHSDVLAVTGSWRLPDFKAGEGPPVAGFQPLVRDFVSKLPPAK